MRPLVIDDTLKRQVETLIQYAQENRITPEIIAEMAAGKRGVAGDDRNRVIITQFGYKIVFSIEGHPQEKGAITWFRRLSVSVDNPTALPSRPAVEIIAELFGFPRLEDCEVFPEQYPGGMCIEVASVIGKSTDALIKK